MPIACRSAICCSAGPAVCSFPRRAISVASLMAPASTHSRSGKPSMCAISALHRGLKGTQSKAIMSLPPEKLARRLISVCVRTTT